MRVVDAEEADAGAIAELLAAQMRDHRIERKLDEMVGVVRTIIRDERHGFLLVGKIEGKVEGVAYVAAILSAEHGGRAGWLEELYVRPGQRGKGMGTALVQAMIERARNLKLVALELEVDIEHRRAESLYQRFGFSPLPRSRWVKIF